MNRRALPPAAAFAAALLLYLATAAQVHRGDTVGLLVETRQGLAHDPAHLLVRPLLGVVLTASEALAPDLSPWTVMAGLAALCGALIAAATAGWLLRREVGAGLALVAAGLVSLSFSGWALSTTFEAHGLPLAALLGMVLVLDRRPLTSTRAAWAGALYGLAVGFHFIAAPVGLAWVALLAVDRAPWRYRAARIALVLLTAAAVLQVGHALTFLLPDPGAPPTHWLYPVALLDQGRQLASTEAIAPVAAVDLPGAVQLGLAQGAVAMPTGALGPWTWTGLMAALVALAAWRAPSMWRRHRVAALVAPAWLVAATPLAAWVGPHNYEYYRGTWVAAAWLAALVAADLLASRGRQARLAVVALGAVAAAGLALANWGSIDRERHSPTGEPAGIMDSPSGPTWYDGREAPLRAPRSPPPRR